MPKKETLKTVRFKSDEAAIVDNYLKQNIIFESFSSLARVATLAFIGQEQQFHLKPVEAASKMKRPYFIWDYDISEIQVREILGQHGFSDQKLWLIARILAEARFEDVMQYLSIHDIEKALPKVRLLPKVKERWEYTIKLWAEGKQRNP